MDRLSGQTQAAISAFLQHLLFPFPLSSPKSLRQGLWKTKEQAQHQEQLLKEQEWLLKTLQEQLSR